MNRFAKLATATAAMATAILSGTTAWAQATFQGLGDLPGGVFQSRAFGVSADGSAVVGMSPSNSGLEAFRWTSGGGMVGLDDLPGGGEFFGFALGASADGSVVVGGSESASAFEAFQWTSGGGIVALSNLPGGGFDSFAFGASADGSFMVGWSDSASGIQASRWTSGGGVAGLGDLPGGSFESRAFGVSADGSVVVGGGESASGLEAFRWTLEGGMIGLGDLPGGTFASSAFGVSGDGLVVVGWSDSASGIEAVLWTLEGGMVSLGDLPGGSLSRIATDVSADGLVVVGFSNSALGGDRAFLWDTLNGMRSIEDVLMNDFALDLTGWILREATGISDDGRTIVGWGVNPDGFTEGWIANISQPIPAFMDIKPGACPNRLNAKSRGVLPAALVGTPDFDTANIDPATVRLSRADGVGGSVAPLAGPPGPHPVIADVAAPFDGDPCDCHNLEADAIDDLSLKFDVAELTSTLELNESNGGSIIELLVTGELFDGSAFEARDCVTLVPPADIDADGDVDGGDFAFFAACFNRAGHPPRGGCSPGQAAAFDFDDDQDIDGTDFAKFAACFNKTGNPPRTLGCPQN